MRKVLGIDKNISIADDVDIILETKDYNECLSNPYKIDKVTIYFVSREFFESTTSEYDHNVFDETLLKEYKELKKIACENPTTEILNKIKFLENKIESSKLNSKFFFKEALPVRVFGGYKCNEPDQIISCTPVSNSEFFPAWLNPELVPEDLKQQVSQDNILENIEEGKFLLRWQPFGMREGDYFICWTWQPNVAGDSISSHLFFNLEGNTQLTTALPTHQTNPEKYEILMERYTPELFKAFISENDLSPYVIQELNNSVAKGFTFLEDLANQIIDLLDSNSIQEQFLPVLSNYFNLDLKSNDPTLWRRQIKKAIPNFKKKGTVEGLKEAYSDAGYNLLKVTRLWQILSKYTYQESFEFNDSYEFELNKKIILPLDENNFGLWGLKSDSSDWIKLDSSYISFEERNEKLVLIWQGGEDFDFEPKDYIRILYKTKEIPNEQEQQYENYIRNLSLMDLRDERNQEYPPKNWNTYLIEEDDPLFNVLIPVRHPFHDYLIWGQIRTEFPYSENAYNMEEYNGSIRDSLNPCDIDKNFIDPCGDCQSSKLTIDLEIEELSNDRIKEAEKIFYEFVPFHSLVHSINYNGIVNEFIKPPIEEITTLISYFGNEILLSGEAQHIFNRAIPYDEAIDIAKRDMLSTMVPATESLSGTIQNESIILISPSSTTEDLENSLFKNQVGISNFKSKGINTSITNESNPFDNSNLLQVLSPSFNAGFYSVSDVTKNYVKINPGTVFEPLNKKQFSFKLFNKLHSQNVSIKKINKFTILNKKSEDFVNFESKILKITSSDTSNFNIVSVVEVKSDGSFVVEDYLDDNSVPLGEGPTSTNNKNINFNILNSNIYFDAKINISTESVLDFGSYSTSNFKIGDYIFYDENQYLVKRIIDENKLSIDLNEGDAEGALIYVYRILFENNVGQFDYLGLSLETNSNNENELGIQNGKNPTSVPVENDQFKENYLILINNQYYTILEIEENKIILDGPINDWTLTGTSVNYIIYRFNKESISIKDRVLPEIKGHEFNYQDDPPKGLGGHIDRSGSEVVYLNTKTYSTILNSMNNKENVNDLLEQNEDISYQIEYREDLENE